MTATPRYSIRSVIAWRIVTELIRRHHARSKLRLLILHPSGGTSKQLALSTDDGHVSQNAPFWRELCYFSLVDATLWIKGSAHGKDSVLGTARSDLPLQLLSDDPALIIDQVQAALRLPETPKPLPPSTPAVLSFRLMAELIERSAFSRESVDIDCGWFSAAGEGTGIDSTLRAFSLISAELPYSAPHWETRAVAASRFWILRRVAVDGVAAGSLVVIDLRGLAFFLETPDAPWNFWKEYNANGRKLLPLVHRLETAL